MPLASRLKAVIGGTTMINDTQLRLKNVRSTRGRAKSVAESTIMMYRLHPHYPDLEDEMELRAAHK